MAESDESQAGKRPSFFSGRFLSPEDFAREQEYVRDKLKRHNRTLHGFGIVSGLRVTIDKGTIVVQPGLALDCEGNELLIETPQSVVPPLATSPEPSSSEASETSLDASSAEVLSSDASSAAGWHTAYLNVRFVAERVEPIPSPDPEQAANSSVHLVESFALEIARENCNRAHRHVRARWLACGQPHALTIAKLRHRSQGWTVDRGYRPPSVK